MRYEWQELAWKWPSNGPGVACITWRKGYTLCYSNVITVSNWVWTAFLFPIWTSRVDLGQIPPHELCMSSWLGSAKMIKFPQVFGLEQLFVPNLQDRVDLGQIPPFALWMSTLQEWLCFKTLSILDKMPNMGWVMGFVWSRKTLLGNCFCLAFYQFYQFSITDSDLSSLWMRSRTKWACFVNGIHFEKNAQNFGWVMHYQKQSASLAVDVTAKVVPCWLKWFKCASTQPDIFGHFSIINLPSIIYQHHLKIVCQLWKAGLLCKNWGIDSRV